MYLNDICPAITHPTVVLTRIESRGFKSIISMPGENVPQTMRLVFGCVRFQLQHMGDSRLVSILYSKVALYGSRPAISKT